MAEIEVDALTGYNTAHAPDELYSGGHGPCLVVGAIYYKKGYMSHDFAFGKSANLEKLLSDLKQDVKNMLRLKIYVGGLEIEYDDDEKIREHMRDKREKVLARISKKGFAKAIKKVEWCESGYNQELILKLSEGRAEFENDLLDNCCEDEYDLFDETLDNCCED